LYIEKWMEDGSERFTVKVRPNPTPHAMNDIMTRGEGTGRIARGTKRGVKEKWNGAERSGFGRGE
jgi:hypothetical protein